MKTSQKASQIFMARNSARADFNRYAHLRASDSFENINSESNLLHPYLLEGLQSNNYTYLTNLQREAIDCGILEGKHVLMRSANGTGKTLAYLLPVFNNLYNYYAENLISQSSIMNVQKAISKDNEGTMF